MKRLAIPMLAALLTIAGCKRPAPEAYVECRSAGATLGAGMACTIGHRAGGRSLHACWTITIQCVNGARGSADGCGDVAPKAMSSVLVPFTAFKGTLDNCDQVSAANVANMKLTEVVN